VKASTLHTKGTLFLYLVCVIGRCTLPLVCDLFVLDLLGTRGAVCASLRVELRYGGRDARRGSSSKDERSAGLATRQCSREKKAR
jgi:hypothetical protein